MAKTDKPIFVYLRMLHANGGSQSPETRRFKTEHLNDPRNKVLARGAERLFLYKDEILAELDALERRRKKE